MAYSLPPALTPSDTAFLCEMELVTVIPRQKLSAIELLGKDFLPPVFSLTPPPSQGDTPSLTPPFPASLPLWLALLLKKQKRANISPPPWLAPENLQHILDFETDDRSADVFSPSPRLPPLNNPDGDSPDSSNSTDGRYLHPSTLEFSAPFIPDSATTRAQPDALPYHWLELGHLLLTHAADDFGSGGDDATRVRQLLQDLREVRASKLRRGFGVLDASAAVKMNGVGGLEVAEVRGFVTGVVDGLRRLNRSREEAQRDRGDNNDYEDDLERSSGYAGNGSYNDENDDDMQL